jgi:hypothetical protein
MPPYNTVIDLKPLVPKIFNLLHKPLTADETRNKRGPSVSTVSCFKKIGNLNIASKLPLFSVIRCPSK